MRISFWQISNFVWKHCQQHWGWVLVLIILLILQSASEVVMPYLVGIFTDYLANNINTESAMAFRGTFLPLGLITAVGIIYWILRVGGSLLFDRFQVPLMRDVAVEAFSKVQRFSTEWHVNSFAGATVRKITRGMWAFNLFLDQFYFGFIPLFFLLIGVIVSMVLRWQLMGILVAVGCIIYTFVSILLVKIFIIPVARESAAADTKLGATLADSVTCNATVKMFGREEAEDQLLTRVAENWRKKTWRTWVRHSSVNLAQAGMMTVVKLAMLTLAAWLWAYKQASVGDAAFVIASYNLISSHLRNIGEKIREVQKASTDLSDAVEFSLLPLEVMDVVNAKTLLAKRGEIIFEKVKFRYANQTKAVYQNLSVEIQPGEKIALVGHSGGGKSTFVKLIQRLYDLNSGAIKIDGQNIAEVTQESLRRAIGVVPQEPILFHRSLAENIAYGKPEATFEEIKRAAKLANASEFIEKLPLKYETLVGERGIKLSGGERQRGAIARAMLSDTPILILDEATSSLDSESEKLIQDALKKLMRGRTTIVIAHRLSTIKSVNRILVFENGKIVESGHHATLVRKKSGIYRKLYELQAGGFIAE
ncbi:MAG: ABC transporter ATP-binding protein [Candidatus Gracilibacteria bacterium]|nr:ABC transporter ATP-binding protein [Candidatus Gracilibacteria bacterium]